MTVAVYMITYMDRVVISNAAPSIRSELRLSLVAMGWILASFRWSYALFQIPGGWLGPWAARADADCRLVEHFYVRYRNGLERRDHDLSPLLFRSRRGGRLSDRDPLTFALALAG